MWIQKEIILQPRQRGFHLITDEVIKNIPELIDISIGSLSIFIKHTSASLTINEDADHTVRIDFESYFNEAVPENAPYYKHSIEGPDDMPAHLKSSILGSSITVPISDGNVLDKQSSLNCSAELPNFPTRNFCAIPRSLEI